MGEHELYKVIAIYLQKQYPKVIYRFDLAADLKLTIGQAYQHKVLHPYRGFPDLAIFEPQEIPRPGLRPVARYNGLFIELKKEGIRLKKRNGNWASDHIKEQAWMLEQLRKKGYKAEFAVGYQEAINLIEDYLGGKK